MDILIAVLTILGLSLFELVSSVDNAVINADVLHGMSQWARRWFLMWGLIVAVFLVRGLLPLLIVYFLNPHLGLIGAFTEAFSNDPAVAASVEANSAPLLMAGGVFLIFLFLHWLFIEPKNYGLKGEAMIHKHGMWFYAIVSIILSLLVWFSLKINPLAAFGATVGSSIFFLTHGFKENAAAKEKQMLKGGSEISDWSKILYLEVIDASFSIDGVLGAFAFTFSVPIILLGNGIGAIAVRQITVRNIHTVKKYLYLKNGAMYSIAFLGVVMVANAFGAHVPEVVSPIVTIFILGYFYLKLKREVALIEKSIGELMKK